MTTPPFMEELGMFRAAALTAWCPRCESLGISYMFEVYAENGAAVFRSRCPQCGSVVVSARLLEPQTLGHNPRCWGF